MPLTEIDKRLEPLQASVSDPSGEPISLPQGKHVSVGIRYGNELRIYLIREVQEQVGVV